MADALNRAYSLVSVKAFDPVKRTFTGLATAPEPDRMGDVIVPEGVRFKNPLPLMLYHDSKKPVGEANFHRASSSGIPFDARISTIDRETGVVRERLDEAVDSLRADPPLIRGVSIGFRPLKDPTYIKETGGFRFDEIEVIELSMVVIPAQQNATIALVKSLDIGLPALGAPASAPPAGVSAPVTVKAMNISDRITALQADRQKTSARMTTLYQPLFDGTGDLNADQRKEYDGLKGTLAATDATLSDLLALEQSQVIPSAQPTSVLDFASSKSMRNPLIGNPTEPALPPGIAFTRAVICKVASRIFGDSPIEIAKTRFPSHPSIAAYLKAAVAGATTTDASWAAPLVSTPTTLTGEFLDFLRPMTVVGKFGTGGIPSLSMIPFNSRIQSQTTGGSANWVGQTKPKPVTKFGYDDITLLWAKIAAIAVLSDELIRFSTPSAEARVRDALARAIVERLDIDFIDPDKSEDTNVSPGSITNGVSPLSGSGGSDADAVRADVQTIMGAFIAGNIDPTSGVWIMPNTIALTLSLMLNQLGQPEFPSITMRGGSFVGFPVIATQYATFGSPGANVVILVNAKDVFLADDGGVTVDASNQASIEMSSDPLNDSGTVPVSMYQTNQVALKAERYINWKRGRDEAVAWMANVVWDASA